MATPARADAATARPVFPRNSRRDEPGISKTFMSSSFGG